MILAPIAGTVITRHADAVSPGAMLTDSALGLSAFAMPPSLGTPRSACPHAAGTRGPA